MTCRGCNTEVIGVDKRASRCKPCASKAAAQPAPVPEGYKQSPEHSEVFTKAQLLQYGADCVKAAQPAPVHGPSLTDLAGAIEYADARWSGVDVPIEWARHFADAIGKPYASPPAQPAPVQPVASISDEQDAFEKVFKLPDGITRFDGGYAPTSYSAWSAQQNCYRWEGWKARSKLCATPPAAPVPLTNEALEAVIGDWSSLSWGGRIGEVLRIARAIEQAHGITKGQS
jgi:hypothetical protein